jgi:hypothetical protein
MQVVVNGQTTGRRLPVAMTKSSNPNSQLRYPISRARREIRKQTSFGYMMFSFER